MQIKDIIDTFNKVTYKHYILHRRTKSNTTIKAMKQFIWTLYEVNKDQKSKILEINQLFRIVDNKTEEAELVMSKLLLEKLFELLNNGNINSN